MKPIYTKGKDLVVYEDRIKVKQFFKEHEVKLSDINSVESNNFLKILTVKTKNKEAHPITFDTEEYFIATKDFLNGEVNALEFTQKITELNNDPKLQKTKEKKKNDLKQGLVFSILILLIGSIWFFSRQETKPHITETQQEKSPTERQAKTISEMIIQNMLKSPSTAKFPIVADSTSKSGKIYYIYSHVDSQNGFGAIVRNNYSISLEYLGGDWSDIRNWKLISIDIQ